MLIIRIILIVVILLIIAYLGIGAYAASVFTLPARNFNPELNPGKYGLEYEELRIPARNDKLEIAAWYIPSDQNQHAIILVHGKDNSRTNGFVDLFVPFAAKLHEAGFSVMMIDLRGHGQSADSRFYFGIKERQDVLGAVDWLEQHGYQAGKIGVLGYSLGAGSVIGAASEEQDIGAVWVDSAYADIRSVLVRSWVTVTGAPQVFMYSTEWMVRLLYGYDISAARPIDEIGKIAPRPIFLAHCQKDNLIPISHLDRLLAGAQNTQSWIITDCDQSNLSEPIVPDMYNNHAIGYYFQPDEYAQKVIQFFNESLE
jgi:dipeptidyl aminopeptidase/acylaminoacyl peptidase